MIAGNAKPWGFNHSCVFTLSRCPHAMISKALLYGLKQMFQCNQRCDNNRLLLGGLKHEDVTVTVVKAGAHCVSLLG